MAAPAAGDSTRIPLNGKNGSSFPSLQGTGCFMTVMHSAVRRLFWRLPPLAGALAMSLAAIHCGGGGAPLETIDRGSFRPCSEIVHSGSAAKYLATASTGGAYALLGDAIAKVAKGSPDTQ